MTPAKNQTSFNSQCCGSLLPWAMLAGLIVIGFSSRLFIAELPNFKPIAAIALFSGFYFRKSWMALLATSLALLISDWQIGSYHWPIALSVYGSLLAGCLIGRYFIGSNKQQNGKLVAIKTAAAAITMSCLFFVVTNFSVWASGLWYPQGLEGLISCYVNAIPFFKYTIAGDVLFTTAIFGCYALSVAMAARKIDLVTLSANTSK